MIKKELFSLSQKETDAKVKKAVANFVAAAAKKKKEVNESAVFIIREARKNR